MYNTTTVIRQDTDLNIRLNSGLKESFSRVAERNNTTMADLIRHFMETVVKAAEDQEQKARKASLEQLPARERQLVEETNKAMEEAFKRMQGK
jgi:antitoxin component of RelBE/YafQ-DinJ toxin-antitoxin module